jgi:hypothetical protein
MPGRLAELEDAPWLNAWAIDLDPGTWADAGLFDPTTPERAISAVRSQLEALFEPVDPGLAPGAVQLDL